MPPASIPLERCPEWPRGLTKPEAARYVGVSETTFDLEIAAGIWPPGMPRGGKGGRLVWDRATLDRVYDAVFTAPSLRRGKPAH